MPDQMMNDSVEDIPLNHPLVIGHRGAPNVHLENTLESFQAAIDMNVDMFELDIQQTMDGEIVVFHDHDTARLAKDSRLISEMTLAEIREIELRNGYAIPTLSDVLEISRDRVQVNIEIKVPDIESNIVDLVESHNMLDQVIFSSFIHSTLQNLNRIIPHARIGLLYNTPIEEVASYAQNLQAYSLHPLFFLLEPTIVEQAHDANLKVFPWTVNDEEMIRELFKMGVDGIITDEVSLGVKVREEMFC